MTIWTRDYEESDLDRCVELWRLGSAVGHPFLSDAERDGDAALVRSEDLPQSETVVAGYSEEVSAYISLWGNFIGALFVDPADHGRGLGRHLVEVASDRKGELRVSVYERNIGAIRFYTATGFMPVSKRTVDEAGRPFSVVTMLRPAPA